MTREIDLYLRVEDVDGVARPILYIPGEPSRIEIEQVINALMTDHWDFFAEHGGMEYRLETPNPDDGPLGCRRLRVRTEFVQIGTRAWEPWIACASCNSSGRRGFANRLPCDDCVDGLRGFHLALNSVNMSVYTESEEQQPTLWSCRMVSPRPIPVSLGPWLGWLKTAAGVYEAVSACDPSDLKHVIQYAEAVAEELEQLAPDLT